MGRTHEPFFWSLFGAGGMAAALVVPVMIVLTGLSGSLGWSGAQEALAHPRMSALLAHPASKAFLFAVVSLSFFHCAHRIRHTLIDVGLQAVRTPLAAACYLGALGGTVACAVLLWRV